MHGYYTFLPNPMSSSGCNWFTWANVENPEDCILEDVGRGMEEAAVVDPLHVSIVRINYLILQNILTKFLKLYKTKFRVFPVREETLVGSE